MYSIITKTARFVVTCAFFLVLLPVAAEFFIALASEKGLYDNPSQKLESAMSWVSSITSWALFPYLVGLFAGFSAFAWGDYLLRKYLAPPLIRQLIKDELLKNAIAFVAIKPFKILPYDGNPVNLFAHIELQNTVEYPIYFRLSEAFFALNNITNQDDKIDSGIMFFHPDSHKKINIPVLENLHIQENMIGRFRMRAYFGVHKDCLDQEFFVDGEVQISFRHGSNGERHFGSIFIPLEGN